MPPTGGASYRDSQKDMDSRGLHYQKDERLVFAASMVWSPASRSFEFADAAPHTY